MRPAGVAPHVCKVCPSSSSQLIVLAHDRLDARRLWPKLYSYSMARKMLRSLLPHLLVPDTPLSSPESPLHPHLPALLSMAGRYRWTLRASHVMEAVAAKVGGSGEHFPFAGMNEFLSWACPGAWLGRIKRCVDQSHSTDAWDCRWS